MIGVWCEGQSGMKMSKRGTRLMFHVIAQSRGVTHGRTPASIRVDDWMREK